MYDLVTHILTTHSLKSIDKWKRYGQWTTMVISLLVVQILKLTAKPIDWIFQPLQQPILRVPL